MIVYAGNADFICAHLDIVERIKTDAPAVFARWFLKMNVSKTDLTLVKRHVASNRPRSSVDDSQDDRCPSAEPLEQRTPRAAEESWRNTRKMGSLLGDVEDVSNRKRLAAAALRRMWVIWIRPNKVSEDTRLRLYSAYVLPILLYNCGTWALTHAQLTGLESFHRQQLQKVLQLQYPRYISNEDLYERCGTEPLRFKLLSARWQLFGHILRRSPSIPANHFMTSYFDASSAGGWIGRRRTTLPQVLAADLATTPDNYQLHTAADLNRLRQLAQDRSDWKRHTRTMLARRDRFDVCERYFTAADS